MNPWGLRCANTHCECQVTCRDFGGFCCKRGHANFFRYEIHCQHCSHGTAHEFKCVQKPAAPSLRRAVPTPPKDPAAESRSANAVHLNRVGEWSSKWSDSRCAACKEAAKEPPCRTPRPKTRPRTSKKPPTSDAPPENQEPPALEPATASGSKRAAASTGSSTQSRQPPAGAREETVTAIRRAPGASVSLKDIRAWEKVARLARVAGSAVGKMRERPTPYPADLPIVADHEQPSTRYPFPPKPAGTVDSVPAQTSDVPIAVDFDSEPEPPQPAEPRGTPVVPKHTAPKAAHHFPQPPPGEHQHREYFDKTLSVESCREAQAMMRDVISHHGLGFGAMC
ncbi:unnamed protein product [Symbiodinium natans]|uniref:Uncharacterized protein n=1 Tax=Symbiodinium natans TaxID=878477 RepID=A0A812P067_9DINO|nr:unnamed protein product [Symbiodinium natans]